MVGAWVLCRLERALRGAALFWYDSRGAEHVSERSAQAEMGFIKKMRITRFDRVALR